MQVQFKDISGKHGIQNQPIVTDNSPNMKVAYDDKHLNVESAATTASTCTVQ